MLFNNFICLSAASRVAKTLVILAVLLSITSAQRTWDSRCLDNNSFSMVNFEKVKGAANHMVNGELFDIMRRRGSKIPSAIQITIDANQGMYNNKVEYCPRSQPMPIKQNREDLPLPQFRDVCFTIKIGPNQLQSAVTIDLDAGDTEENNQQRADDLAELVEEIKEFNTGNCLKDINNYLFASYDQTLFTTAEFKYYWNDGKGKSNLKTPENVYFVREKLHGTVRDVINDKFTFITENKNKLFNDVIIFQMARSVSIMHGMGWVHRDIKPDNFYVKKTVDKKLEVYLGEFYNSLMSEREPAELLEDGEENPEHHVHGGPFYQPRDITKHMASIKNDLYAMGISLVELLTHDDVEDVYVEVQFDGEKNPEIHIDDFANEEIFEQDKLEFVVVQNAEDELDQHMPMDFFTLDDHPDFEFEDTMKNNSPIRDVNINYESFVAFNLDNPNNIRILEDNKNEGIKNRLLSGSVYGEMDNDLFGVVNNDTYGEINHNPLADEKTNDIIHEADKIDDSVILHDHFHTTLSLPSVDEPSLVIEKNEIETVQKDLLMDLQKNDIFKNEEIFDNPNAIIDPIVTKTANGTKYISAQYFLKLLIANLMSNNEFDRLMSSDKNKQLDQQCKSQWVKMRGKADLSSKQKQYGDARYKQALNNPPSALECVMIFAAKSIRQKKKSGKSDDFDYFSNLDVSTKTVEMEDVFKIIISDRLQSYTHHTMSYKDYMTEINKTNNRLLLI